MILTVEQRQAQIEMRDGQRAVDLKRLTERGRGIRIVELLEIGHAAVVGDVRALERVPPRRPTTASARGDGDRDQCDDRRTTSERAVDGPRATPGQSRYLP